MDMLVHVRWRAVPQLLIVAAVALAPALLVWAAALVQTLGLAVPLSRLPAPAAAVSHTDRLTLFAIFWGTTLASPLVAGVLSLAAMVDAEFRIEHWEISGRLRLPAPPWRWSQALAVAVLGLGLLLFMAMAGHLAADCLLGRDCPSM